MTTLEAPEVLELNTNVYDALRSHNLPAKLIENKYKEPLAVLARGILDPALLLGSVTIRKLFEQRDYASIMALASTIPVSGSMIYPPQFLEILDIVVEAASNIHGCLATEMRNIYQDDDDEGGFCSIQGASLGLHRDGRSAHITGYPLYWLNAHFTRAGSYSARFGLLRCLEDDEQIRKLEEKSMDYGLGWQTRVEASLAATEAYERLGAPYSEPVEGREGDLLIFQGGSLPERRLLPVTHEFVTTSEMRRSDTFRPLMGDAATVKTARATQIAAHSLDLFGYELAS